MRGLTLLVVSSTLIWAVEVGSYAALFPAFALGLSAASFWPAALLMAVVFNLITLVPSSPGYVGSLQFAGVLALSAFGVGAAEGLAVSVIAHASQLAVVLTLTAWAVWAVRRR